MIATSPSRENRVPEEESVAALVRELIGTHTQGEMGRLTGVSQTVWTRMLQGQRPSPESAVRIADSLEMDAELRRRWFAAARAADPRARYVAELSYEAVLDDVTIAALRGAKHLPESDLTELRQLLPPDLCSPPSTEETP